MNLRIYQDSGNSPCKGCECRFVGCHSKCVKYIDWQQKHLLQKHEAMKKAKNENAFHAYEKETKRKAARKRDGK